MNPILGRLAAAFGAMIFVLTAVIGFLKDIPAMVIIFRGVIAMSLSTVTFLAFARFFQKILYRFVAEQVMMQKGRGAAGENSRQAPLGALAGDIRRKADSENIANGVAE